MFFLPSIGHSSQNYCHLPTTPYLSAGQLSMWTYINETSSKNCGSGHKISIAERDTDQEHKTEIHKTGTTRYTYSDDPLKPAEQFSMCVAIKLDVENSSLHLGHARQLPQRHTFHSPPPR